MESDHQAIIHQENSEQDDQQQQGGSAAAKSYECNFCKRGFSNAQALGGHMNIHRKDKAKLKQVLSSSSASNTIETKQQQQQRAVLDIPKMPPLFPPTFPTNINSNLFEANRPNNISHDIDHQRNSARASPWPWFLHQEGDTPTSTIIRPIDHHHQNHDVQVQQLPFFSHRPSPDHQNPGQNERSLQPPSDSELDLELRLGPQDSSSSTANSTTRKFF